MSAQVKAMDPEDSESVHSEEPPRLAPLFRVKKSTFGIGLAVWVIGFATAFALSWKTNTHWDRGLFAKLVYGTGAGLHSWSYPLLWLMYVWGRHNPASFCAKMAAKVPVVVEAASVVA